MKPIPRIVGGLWPTFFVIMLLLFMPLLAFAQDGDAGDAADEGSGEAIEESGDVESGETSVAEGEDAVDDTTEEPSTEGEEAELIELSPDEVDPMIWAYAEGSTYGFDIPSEFKVSDHANDEGGVLDMILAPTGTDPDGYEYWGFESATGEPGTWTQFGSIPTDGSYTWEAPNLFGFFLSEQNKGNNEHYFTFSSTYPRRGIHTYGITTNADDLNKVTVTVEIYDEGADYSSMEVNAQLKPIGGDKLRLAYDEAASSGVAFGAVFTGTSSWTPLNISITKSSWLTITADTKGTKTVVLEAQNSETRVVSETGDPELDLFERRISGSGSEGSLPDNRDPHHFMVYAVPAGYHLPYFPDPPEGYVNPEGLVLPEGSDLPPDEWRVGAAIGPVTAKQNPWNSGRTNNFLFALMICAAVMWYIFHARKGASLFLRRIAGLDHVEEAIGRATEMGRPVLYTTGLGMVSDIASIASINILGQVAKKVADYDSKLINPHRDPIMMAVCQEVVQEAYIDAGRPDAFVRDNIFFITDDQFAYAAAVNGIMVREKPATILLMGLFYAESLLLAETGASTGAIQIAGTDAQAQLPFFITACDYTLIGEELYAASAYLSREPLLVGSLKGQDFSKLIFMVLTFIGTLLIFANIEFIKQLFQAY